MSKFFYLASFYGGMGGYMFLLIVGIVIMGVGGSQELPALMAAGGFVLVLGVSLAIYAAVVMFVFIYKMWDAIQPAMPRTTPGKAVGFMFIPFFNFYWMFMVWHGFAQDFNAYVSKNRLPAVPVPEGLALAVCICAVSAIVPYIGMLPALANLVLIGILMSNICDSVNSLPDPGMMPPGVPNYDLAQAGAGYPPPGAGYPPMGGYPPAGGYPPGGGPPPGGGYPPMGGGNYPDNSGR